MLPTFVIGLREGLEAALIVGIIAAFLAGQGRRDAIRQLWIGVAAAIVICLGVGFGLNALERSLPQRQQEQLETVIGLIAVSMVTWMIFWMRKNARHLKKDLESAAGSALARGSARALVVMAFLAVFREGFETAVFLLSVFQSSTNAVTASFGAVLGILLASALGYGIYRGGVRINLQKFFTVTGSVLVVVAGGLLMTAAHTAHEAGWLDVGQGTVADLTWLVTPGTAQAALITGVLGIQPQPTVAEVTVWVLYVVPMLFVVLWKPRRKPAAKPVPDEVRSAA
ncbi:iron uptake transporter permease EfeU [Angustibacter sp. McL0619]|uniref:iron uptake transporter permease EfeU n=1 Tax=Angustibacter sp. McL0619 TaxID=3415676 RepID=UPI003CF7D370